ncbi:MAG: hypothetical protein IPK14_18045 [Blastocatellia bacterium]|nr:hypothetical protein [Blastocatellia bacterium]
MIINSYPNEWHNWYDFHCLPTKTSAEQQDFIETIRVSGESLLTIINDILDFSN